MNFPIFFPATTASLFCHFLSKEICTNLSFALLFIFPGDIDPEFNVVEITEEAKAELARIDNKIGAFVCRLCKKYYDDAFGLAQHRLVIYEISSFFSK